MSFAPKNIPSARMGKVQGRSGWGLGVSLAFLFAFGAFVSGLQIGRGIWIDPSVQPAGFFNIFSANGQTKAANETRPNLAEFWAVWDLLEEKFVVSSSTSKQTDEERIQGAIDGLVDSYDDPYTVYMPPADAEKFSEDISGNFSGVGMEVGLRDKIITVIAPLPDTPAERAGMMAGDAIVKINGSSTEDMSIDEAVSLIRGEKGTIVELQIYREGATEFQTISITRDTINIPTVRTEQVDGTFIIALYSFNAIAESEVTKALEEYTKSGAKTLAIDLRGNPGGFLQSAVAIASYFLPAGKVVVSEDFGGGKEGEVFRSRGRQIQHFTPQNLVVLVDGGSASASEILAGALKDHGVATVIGAQTFGKGSVQELVTLDDGASLKVTVARWLTPNGTSISDGGLSPDIVISRTIEDRQNNVDPQKEAAVRFLSGKTVISESSDSIEAGE